MGRLIDEDDVIEIVKFECGDWVGLAKTIENKINALSSEPQWIPCSECINYIDERCVVANHHVSEKENCMEVFGAKRRTVQGGS